MEQVGMNWDKSRVISALAEGQKHANELKRLLMLREDCGLLLEQVLSSYEHALALLGNHAYPSQMINNHMLESPFSVEDSPRSEGSEPDSKDHVHRDVSKKRKTMPKWSEQVRVCSGIGLDGQVADGYNWRKYGQKDILGANHPRAYYRCTHRNTQGCLATKQVQRTDEDSSVFEVIYRGKHTCIQERLKPNKESPKSPKGRKDVQSHSKRIRISPEPSDLKVETQVIEKKVEKFPSFSFPSTPIEPEDVETIFFQDQSNFVGTSYSPQLFSPATSESYFSLSPSPCQVNDFSIGHSLQSSEPDLAEIISNPTSVESYMFGEWNVSIDQVDFDSYLLDNF